MSQNCSSISSEYTLPVGGRIKSFHDKWRAITNDPYILSAVQGYKIEFDPARFPPSREKLFHTFKRNALESRQISSELLSLETKNVIERCSHSQGEFISNIFTRPKKSGGLRLILDLSELNKSVAYQHFKMDNINSAVLLLSPDCFMASLDLRDAYYSVPESRKYLRFIWEGQLWQYKALPNGLSSAPRLFTKLLKPAFASLHNAGHVVLGYLDDTLIIGRSHRQATKAVTATSELLSELGFIIHPTKSVIEPVQEIKFLGFVLNSIDMTVTLPSDKKEELKETCTALLENATPSIRQVARVIGKLVAAFPAAQYGLLHYRELERGKIVSLRLNRGHFDRPMKLLDKARRELLWWIGHIDSSFRPINRRNPDLELRSDASGAGWGATNMTTHTGGRWNSQEAVIAKGNEINYLETLAAGLALKSFCSNMSHKHVLLRLDNTTAVAYVNAMGGVKSPHCNEAATHIWNWCIERDIWITAAHLAGRDNVEADTMSRKFNDRTEWMLNEREFERIAKHFGIPDIDLFASRLNAQVSTYVSWRPDPHALAVDAFTLDWRNLNFYAFPPFCLVPKCIQKIMADKAVGLLVVPNWPTQAWFPLLKDMIIGEPLFLPKSEKLLRQPVSNLSHPLSNLDLLCCRLGAAATDNKA